MLEQRLFILGAVFSVLFGATIGSFLNVVIIRMPKGESIAFPGSHCPKCGYELRWFDNIPVLSWLILLGKCRRCKQTISLQYPAIELLNALLFLFVFLEFGWSVGTVVYCVLAAAFVAITFIDLRYYIIPDEITIPGLIAGLVVALFQSIAPLRGLRVQGIGDAALGVLLGGGTLLAIAYLGGYYLRWKLKRFGTGAAPLPEHAAGDDAEEIETMAMGGGDIKLFAMLGAFLGWKGVVMTLALSSILGAAFGIGVMLVARKSGLGQRIPFGPWICVGALMTLLAEPEVLQLYWRFSTAVAHLLGAPAPLPPT